MNCVIEPGLLEGTVSIPASKSAAHRALICAALAKGTSRLTNLSDSEDIAATIGALQQMGAKITRTGSSVTVTGIVDAPTQPITLDCGESGSTLRFLIPVAAALGLTCTIIGKGPTDPWMPTCGNCRKRVYPFSRSGRMLCFPYTCPASCKAAFFSWKGMYPPSI